MGIATSFRKSAQFFDRQVSPAKWQDHAQKIFDKENPTQGALPSARSQMRADLWAPATTLLQGLRWTQFGGETASKPLADAPKKGSAIASPFIFVGSTVGLVVRFILAAAATVVLGVPLALLRPLLGLSIAVGSVVLVIVEDGLDESVGSTDGAIKIDDEKLKQWMRGVFTAQFEAPKNISDILKIDRLKISRLIMKEANVPQALFNEVQRSLEKVWQPMREDFLATAIDSAFCVDEPTATQFVVGELTASLLKQVLIGALKAKEPKEPSAVIDMVEQVNQQMNHQAREYPLLVGVPISCAKAVGIGAAASGALWASGQGMSYVAPFVGLGICMHLSYKKFVEIESQYRLSKGSEQSSEAAQISGEPSGQGTPGARQTGELRTEQQGSQSSGDEPQMPGAFIFSEIIGKPQRRSAFVPQAKMNAETYLDKPAASSSSTPRKPTAPSATIVTEPGKGAMPTLVAGRSQVAA